MRSVAVAVRRSDGEATRRRLVELGLLRTDLAIRSEGDELVFPVIVAPDPLPPGSRAIVGEFEERPAQGPSRYVELAQVPDSIRPRLPRSFDVVGDLVLVRLDPDLAPWAEAVGAALLAFVPGSRAVAIDEGVHGPARLRSLRRIAGVGPFETVHTENGLGFSVDLARAYFSPRLGREHARVAGSASPGESILDLCCGIGPFGLTLLARAGARAATFVDANPDAIALVRENARRFGVADRTRALVASADAFLEAPERFDRVIFNLPHEGIKYLARVGTAVAGGGTLHYYEIMERSAVGERLDALLRTLPKPSEWSIAEHHVVHPYAPTADLVAVTLHRAAP